MQIRKEMALPAKIAGSDFRRELYLVFPLQLHPEAWFFVIFVARWRILEAREPILEARGLILEARGAILKISRIIVIFGAFRPRKLIPILR